MRAFIIVFSALLAVASNASSIAYYANPLVRSYPLVYGDGSSHSSSLITPTQQQYHTQDEFGQYAYGYSEPLSAKQEVRLLDGITRGSYSYRDAEGKLQTVDYTADKDNGFRVAATNLPRATNAVATAATIAEVEQGRNTFRAPQETPTTATADTVEIAAASAIDGANRPEGILHLAKGRTNDHESNTDAANHRSVELPYAVADTAQFLYSKAGGNYVKHHEIQGNSIVTAPVAVRTVLPVGYQPNVYNYGYPLNSRFLSTGFYY